MTKNEIAEILEEIGVLLELKGENPFKIRAYGSGARVLESLESDEFEQLVADGKLDSVKGIGAALAQKIGELHETGALGFYDKLKASIAPGLVEMLEVPGLGAKKIKAIHEKLGIDTMEGLAAACVDGRVAELSGFGAKSAAKIAEGIKNREAYGKRHLWWLANEVAQPIVAGLRERPEVKRAEAAGSLRRGMETVGDLDFIVASDEPAPVMTWFCELPEVKEVTARGETKSSVRFESGLQADLRIVPPGQFVFALHHFTGSKDHNVAMRQRALERGLSLSEWGLVPADGEGTAKEKAERGESKEVADEAGLFKALDMTFVPPALREGLGEIEAAEAGELPQLIEVGDLRGAFHNHTTASDGRNTLAEMVTAAEALGWDYLGIADHSKASFQANGLDEERLLKQVEEIRALNESGRFKTHVFAGSEVDILTDGRLDFADEVMAQLDYVVASVHNAFAQDEDTMTKRIIRAVENPQVTMLGHATGRLLLRREPYKVNLAKVIDAAIANDTIIELNASPWRLDLDWRLWRKAAERGLLCAINPDAHECDGLQHVRAGVSAARKGWLQPKHVLNTWTLEQVKARFS
ncbi:DNA polymerase/3'-5' exonuclease PolX [Actomonas aquatica]|uniref:DNA polymerase beta n=1 Tax=Actomonas aquatica TaxID=2866162 RepID=A0ABZ1CAS6_9BACT|nr:DNA polymerase/3'-5' exonuclease PolX [Opitutus sp. WL0086]WRQ88608.1 DNA polymerase/3'-5' exonuclease PolX [Opitutus sp. WL0086]